MQVEDKTVAGLLALIEAERNGESVDKQLVKHLVRMFTSLGIYSASFEAPFLEQTKQYYSLEGRHFMQQSDVADYLLHCEVCGPPAAVEALWLMQVQQHFNLGEQQLMSLAEHSRLAAVLPGEPPPKYLP